MGAPFIPGVGGKKRAVDGEDLMGEEPQKVDNLYQHVEDLLVELFSQPNLKVGEGCLTGYVGIANPCVKSIVSALIPISQGLQEGFHVGELFKVTKERQKKEADGVIGNTGNAISVRHQRADEREVNQRGNKAGKSSDYAAALFDPDVAMFEGVLGKPEYFRFRKGSEVLLLNADTDAIEFAHYLA